MTKAVLLLCIGMMASCATSSDPLIVKQFTLRDQELPKGVVSMVSHEKQRRLYGAVSIEDRKGRLGQYYTAIWALPAGSAQDGKLVFQYQQGKSGSRVRRMEREISGTHGKEEFAVIGDDYFGNGRVLTWKMSLISGGETVATEQSYLWE